MQLSSSSYEDMISNLCIAVRGVWHLEPGALLDLATQLIACWPSLVGSAYLTVESLQAARFVAVAANRPTWCPGVEPPKHLDGRCSHKSFSDSNTRPLMS